MPCHSACVCRTWETVAASSSPASPRPCTLCWPPPQVQFFALFPLLLCALQPRSRGFRGRLAVAVTACILGGTAWRLAAVWRAPEPLEFPIADFATDTTAQHSWAAMLHATYLPTGARVAELAVGVAQGAMLTSPAALKALQRRCVGCGWLQQCACIAPFSIQCMHLGKGTPIIQKPCPRMQARLGGSSSTAAASRLRSPAGCAAAAVPPARLPALACQQHAASGSVAVAWLPVHGGTCGHHPGGAAAGCRPTACSSGSAAERCCLQAAGAPILCAVPHQRACPPVGPAAAAHWPPVWLDSRHASGRVCCGVAGRPGCCVCMCCAPPRAG